MSTALAYAGACMPPPTPLTPSNGGPAASTMLPGAQAIPSAATAPNLGALITQLQSIVAQLRAISSQLQPIVGAAQVGQGTTPLGGSNSTGASSGCGCGSSGSSVSGEKSDPKQTAVQQAPPPPPKEEPAPAPPPPPPGVDQALIDQWVVGDKDGLNPDLLMRLAQVGERVGEQVSIDSGHRTREEQQELYDAYLNGTGNLAAKPGESNHESGNAADVSIGGVSLRDSKGADVARELGLHWPVESEAWHTELA